MAKGPGVCAQTQTALIFKRKEGIREQLSHGWLIALPSCFFRSVSFGHCNCFEEGELSSKIPNRY